jgi:hypothetical protein
MDPGVSTYIIYKSNSNTYTAILMRETSFFSQSKTFSRSGGTEKEGLQIGRASECGSGF